jgi:hypothetical protein
VGNIISTIFRVAAVMVSYWRTYPRARKLFKENGVQKRLGSRGTYGGSANDVAVEVTDAFSEVVSIISSVRLSRWERGIRVDRRQERLLKDIIAESPSSRWKDGRLTWDPLGMQETWSAKRLTAVSSII